MQESKQKKDQIRELVDKHDAELKSLNTKHIAAVEVKNQEITIKKEQLADIRNWMEQETEKNLDKE